MNLKIILFGIISILLLCSSIVSASTWYVDDDGGPGINFTKIQDAINAAGAGDTILVYSGTYYEYLNVNKKLVLHGQNTGSGAPLINNTLAGKTVDIFANEVTFEGFNVRNGSSSLSGISLNSDNNIIRNNNISDHYYGIELYLSNNNIITNNNATNNYFGIQLGLSNNNTVTNNIANYNRANGIGLSFTRNNTLINNIANSNNENGLVINSINSKISGNTANGNKKKGILVDESFNITIDNNIANLNNQEGIYVALSSNITLANNTGLSNTISGICIRDSNNSFLVNNNFSFNKLVGARIERSESILIENNIALSNNGGGIGLSNSIYNKIIGNNASNSLDFLDIGYNASGIHLEYSEHNIISNNTGISNTGAGIDLYYSNYSTIYNNSLFFNNQAGMDIFISNNNIIIGNNASSNNAHGFSFGDMSGDNLLKDNIVRFNKIDGIIMKENSYHNTLFNNTVSLNGDNGILIMNSSFSDIEGNTVRDHKGAAGEPFGRPPSSGIMVYGSHNIIRKNNVSNNYLGISILDGGPTGDIISTNNTIESNDVNNNSGISMEDGKPSASGILAASNNNIIKNNNGSHNYVGITVFNSSNNIISGNNMNSNNDFGILLLISSYSVIERNTVNDHKGNAGVPNDRPPSSGIAVLGSHNIIRKNKVSNNYIGIGIFSGGPTEDLISTNNTIESNDVDNNSGILMEEGKTPSSGIFAILNNNKINNNNVSHNYFGITVANSSNNTISGNNLSSNNDFGIFIMNVSHSVIEGNIVKHHRGNAGVPNGRPPSSGIILLGSHNIMRKNLVSNNYLGICIFNGGPDGDLISTNNTVEGNEVYQNTGITFGEEGLPPSSGILIASNDAIIKNNNGSKNMVGILIGKSSNNTVFNNNMSNNGLGLVVFEVSNSSIFNNKANSNSETGIYLNLWQCPTIDRII